jgi:RNA polymerase-binding transcription factor DksA
MTGIAERPTTASTAPRNTSGLTSRQRTSLRGHLAGDRELTLIQINQLSTELGAFLSARRDTATDDEHDPEGPTLAFERSQSSALLAQSERHLADIESALLRLDAGTYGICTRCGVPIAIGRLQVRPQSPLCITCAAKSR